MRSINEPPLVGIGRMLVLGILASRCLAGCDSDEQACTSCDARDAAANDAFEPPPACPVKRFCPHVQLVSPQDNLFLGNEAMGNVYVGAGVYSREGPAVPWVALPQPASTTRRAGVALLAQSKVVSFDDQAPADPIPYAPPLFQRTYDLGLVVPFTAYDHVIPIDLDSYQPGTSIPLPATSPMNVPPAVLGVGNALAALLDPGPTLVFFDAALQERLIQVPQADQGTPVHLSETCNGLLGLWQRSDGGRARAFDTLGSPRSAIVNVDSKPSPWARVVWDGASVVVTTEDEILELDNAAQVVSRTPGRVDAAIGTDDGLLVARVVIGSTELALLERGTGQVLQSFDIGSAWLDQAVVIATSRYVYFAGTGGYAGASIGWVAVECTQ